MRHGRKILTLLLAGIGIGIVWYYIQCEDSCAYLAGELMGLDLKTVGLAFMLAVIIATAAGIQSFLKMMLAGGIGGEVYLIGYQFEQDVFCPYCLAFAAVMFAAFAVNYSRPRISGSGLVYLLGEARFRIAGKERSFPLIAFIAAGYAFFCLLFTGSAMPVYAYEPYPRIFGKGPVEIRIYTDYFCSPCRAMEKDIEGALDEIVHRNKGRVIFIDTPIHRSTVLYAKYFVYSTRGKTDYASAKKIRKVLFEAAGQNVSNEQALADYLKRGGIRFNPGETRDVFTSYDRYIREDNIHSTPTCVIATRNGKKKYTSRNEITEVIRSISK
ncbi:MAG: thioredoxin domain-containing protein [Syntrophales bacterium]|nr:thioredoxin domain-containing protein [Syntrophales bacterium]MDD5531727.1 thioredoxin domain-containing protein [Syntrophales bacterium]HPL64650.1 thioredoxin domain-containing protein [Syntrophales bacterium]